LDPEAIRRWFRILGEAICARETKALSTLSGENEKEVEWRFSHGYKNLVALLRNILNRRVGKYRDLV